jgi:hypothetical protein
MNRRSSRSTATIPTIRATRIAGRTRVRTIRIDRSRTTRSEGNALRFIPSGLANEIMLDVVVRLRSFEPNVTTPRRRLYDAYAKEVARVDQNGDGVLTFVEADAEQETDGLSNERLFLPPTVYNRVVVTREINDGLLAPRFAPSQRAYVLSGAITHVKPAVPASVERDGDDR